MYDACKEVSSNEKKITLTIVGEIHDDFKRYVKNVNSNMILELKGKLNHEEVLEQLQQALQALPDRQRQAVILRHIEGLSNPEIADIMDITPGAVESLTARGKRALADILAGRKSELGYQDD